MAESIGRADVELGLDYSDLKRDLDAAEREIKQAGEAAESAFGAKATQGAKGLGGALDGLRAKTAGLGKEFKTGLIQGAGIGAFLGIGNAVQGVIGLLGDARAAFQEDQASIAQLGAALEANVKDWSGNTAAIEETIAARMRLGFADEEQRASLAGLIAITKDETKALELQRTAMDLARLKGISLSAAGDLLGKVYGGNVGILSRYGIVLREGASSTEALAAIQRMATGQAEAFAASNDGRVVASQLKVGEAMERIGEIFSNVAAVVLPVVADGLTVVVDVLGTLISAAQAVAGAILPSFETVGAGIRMLAEFFLTAAGTIVGVAAAIPGPWQEGAKQVQASLDAMKAGVQAWGQETTAEAGLAAQRTGERLGEGLRAAEPGVAAAAAAGLGAPITGALDEANADATATAQQTPADVARALRSGYDEVKSGAAALKDAMADEMTAAQRIAALKGQLAGADLAKGLRSKDPVVRAEARRYKASIEAQIEALRRAASDYGARTGNEYAGGLRLSIRNITAAARDAAAAAGKILRASSPPGPESPLHEIGLWGERTMLEYAAGLRAGGAAVRAASLEALSGFGMPSFGRSPALLGALAGPMGGSVTHGGTIRHELDLSQRSIDAFNRAGYTPRQIGEVLGGAVDATALYNNLRDVAAMRR